MKPTQRLHDLGQSLWLDNITRGLLSSGTLERYVRDLSVTGLTSNPTIFDHAIKNHDFYDDAIRQKGAAGCQGEGLFFEIALEDLGRAADLFRRCTSGRRAWMAEGAKAFAPALLLRPPDRPLARAGLASRAGGGPSPHVS